MIRPGCDEDAAGVIALIRRCWADYEDCVLDVEREAPELLAPASHVAGGVMLVAGDVEAVAMAAPAGPGEWSISRFYVDHAHRGAGLAHRMLDRVEAAATAASATRLSLHSDSRFHGAHAFYENRSFTRRHPAKVLNDISNSVDLLFAKPLGNLCIEALDTAGARSASRPLAEILMRCVDEGASVSFLAPLSRDRARSFWRGIADRVAGGRLVLFAAWLDGRIVGTATLDMDTKPNQQHRADIRKVLVHPDGRGRGIARALMQRAEMEAWSRGRTLLTLDTLTDSVAERMYPALGWTRVGVIPGFSRDAAGRPEATTIFYKALNATPAPAEATA